jgi:hypothetical protein
MATRYQIFRRVAAPVAIAFALFLLFRTGCEQKKHEPVRFGLDFGDTPAAVRHVRVDLWDGDASIGFFEREFGTSGPLEAVRWKQPVSRPDLEATISVTLASGEIVALRRSFHAEPGGEVTLDAYR